MFGKIHERFDYVMEPFDKGLLFCSEKGKLEDLTSLKVLNIAVDTIRQLYSGTIDRLLMNTLSSFTVDGGLILEKEIVNLSNDIYHRNLKIPCDLKLSRMGKNSGYRFKFQNNEVGIVILLGSYFKQSDEEFSHLKIELSPHFIQQRTPKEIQKYLDNVSSLFLDNPEPCGVSPHICVDLQGWEMPLHMEDDIVTRSKRIRTYNGIEEMKFDGLDAVISKFGRKETLMVGRPNSLQLSIYRKDLEIIKTDKVDYYHDLWNNYTFDSFDKTKPVTRIEYRFHHSVIQEFERGIGEDIKTYIEVEQYLNNLWQYALNTIRYTDSDHVAPLWQYLHDDINHNGHDIRKEFKRQQKQKTDTTSINRNIGLFLGNFLTIACRKGMKFRDIKQQIESLSIMEEINNNLLEKRQDSGHFWEELKQKYLERQLASKYSIAA